jgi:hypothetical protein
MIDTAVGARIGVHWKDLQPTADKFNFSAFDDQANPIIKSGKVVVINLGTGNVEGENPAAPEWLFTSGVPKVTTTGGNCPKKTTCTFGRTTLTTRTPNSSALPMLPSESTATRHTLQKSSS